jgi:Rhodanese-related sulfurtransferase
MAMEAVKLITGTGDSLLGRVLVIDALAPSTTTLDFARTEVRPAESFAVTRSDTSIARACVAAPPDSEDPGSVDVGQLLGILEREPDTLLLDVREEEERRNGAIPDSLWVPLGELLDGTGLAELPPGRSIIVYCHAGIRSAVARDLLEASGWAGTRHLTGGIRAWETAGLMTPIPRVQRR